MSLLSRWRRSIGIATVLVCALALPGCVDDRSDGASPEPGRPATPKRPEPTPEPITLGEGELAATREGKPVTEVGETRVAPAITVTEERVVTVSAPDNVLTMYDRAENSVLWDEPVPRRRSNGVCRGPAIAPDGTVVVMVGTDLVYCERLLAYDPDSGDVIADEILPHGVNGFETVGGQAWYMTSYDVGYLGEHGKPHSVLDGKDLGFLKPKGTSLYPDSQVTDISRIPGSDALMVELLHTYEDNSKAWSESGTRSASPTRPDR